MGDLSQSTNTFGKRIKILKTLLKASYDRGHHTNNIFDNRGIKHLSYDSSKGACYYVSKYYDRNIDNDIFVKTNSNK